MTLFPINSKNPVFGPFLAHFPVFGAKKIFLENPALSRTTSYGFLAPSQNLEKVNDTIQRKRPDRRKDGRTDRPCFIGPFQLPPGVQLKYVLEETIRHSNNNQGCWGRQ